VPHTAIITNEIRDLARLIGNAGPDAQDIHVMRLVGLLTERCADPDVKAKLAGADAATEMFAPYPIDADGYAHAFDPLTEEDAFLTAWHRHGFVVGKGIASSAQCTATVAALKDRFNALGCDFDDRASWNALPQDANGTSILSRGFFELYHDDALAQLRQSPRFYLHHVLLWGRPDLWTSFDRLGVKPPEGESAQGLPLHVDQNPKIRSDFASVQGVLALQDCPLERGTYAAVPGSRAMFPYYADMAKNMGEYVELNPYSTLGATLGPNIQPIPLRAGDLVSWDSRTTHCNTANVSDQTRLVAYVAAGPSGEAERELIAARQDGFMTGLGSNVRRALMHASKKPRFTDLETTAAIRQPEDLTLLGRLLYGAARYDMLAHG
jgi:hypothetical protein